MYKGAPQLPQTAPNGCIEQHTAGAQYQSADDLGVDGGGHAGANTKTRGPVVRHQQDDDQEAFGAAQYTKARAVREHYQARLAKLDYEEKVGSLVPGRGEDRAVQYRPATTGRDAQSRGSRVRRHRGGGEGVLLAAGLAPERADTMDMARVHEILSDRDPQGPE